VHTRRGHAPYIGPQRAGQWLRFYAQRRRGGRLKVKSLGCRQQGPGFEALGSEFLVQSSEYRVNNRFRV
jgi:hypothetical protein